LGGAKETDMTDRDGKTERGGTLPVPGGDDPDVRYLTEQTDLSPKQARELIRTHGNDRAKLLKIARTMKAES
jgi:hypothetical protein